MKRFRRLPSIEQLEDKRLKAGDLAHCAAHDTEVVEAAEATPKYATAVSQFRESKLEHASAQSSAVESEEEDENEEGQNETEDTEDTEDTESDESEEDNDSDEEDDNEDEGDDESEEDESEEDESEEDESEEDESEEDESEEDESEEDESEEDESEEDESEEDESEEDESEEDESEEDESEQDESEEDESEQDESEEDESEQDESEEDESEEDESEEDESEQDESEEDESDTNDTDDSDEGDDEDDASTDTTDTDETDENETDDDEDESDESDETDDDESDDDSDDDDSSESETELKTTLTATTGNSGSGDAEFESETKGTTTEREFSLEVNGAMTGNTLLTGNQEVRVGGVLVGTISLTNGNGTLEFSSDPDDDETAFPDNFPTTIDSSTVVDIGPANTPILTGTLGTSSNLQSLTALQSSEISGSQSAALASLLVDESPSVAESAPSGRAAALNVAESKSIDANLLDAGFAAAEQNKGLVYEDHSEFFAGDDDEDGPLSHDVVFESLAEGEVPG